MYLPTAETSLPRIPHLVAHLMSQTGSRCAAKVLLPSRLAGRDSSPPGASLKLLRLQVKPDFRELVAVLTERRELVSPHERLQHIVAGVVVDEYPWRVFDHDLLGLLV